MAEVSQENLSKGAVELWLRDARVMHAQFLKPKRIKFLLVTFEREFIVRHKEKIVYRGFDLAEAVDRYNEI